MTNECFFSIIRLLLRIGMGTLLSQTNQVTNKPSKRTNEGRKSAARAGEEPLSLDCSLSNFLTSSYLLPSPTPLPLSLLGLAVFPSLFRFFLFVSCPSLSLFLQYWVGNNLLHLPKEHFKRGACVPDVLFLQKCSQDSARGCRDFPAYGPWNYHSPLRFGRTPPRPKEKEPRLCRPPPTNPRACSKSGRCKCWNFFKEACGLFRKQIRLPGNLQVKAALPRFLIWFDLIWFDFFDLNDDWSLLLFAKGAGRLPGILFWSGIAILSTWIPCSKGCHYRGPNGVQGKSPLKFGSILISS